MANLSSKLSGRPASQSSIKIVKWLVIDAQGVVETSQSTYIHRFFTVYRLPGVSGPSLAFPEDLSCRFQITFLNKH